MTELLKRLVRWRAHIAGDTLAPMAEELEHAKELWTAQRTAEWLGISRQALHDRIVRGTVRPHYLVHTAGGRSMYLFDPARIKRWRDSHT